MNDTLYKGLKVGRRIVRIFNPSPKPLYQGPQLRGPEANGLISQMLLKNNPAMIARFGSNELNCMAAYKNMKHNPNDYAAFLKGEIDFLKWDQGVLDVMRYVAGFFPVTPPMLEKFTLLMVEDMRLVDILGSWCTQERFFNDELAEAKKVPLPNLEPYYHAAPWSQALAGKTVLVVHPFEESIRQQYNKRDLLFKDKSVLPEFELKTYRSVQSLADNKTAYSTWFDALDFMKGEIEKIDFDIAILGCGAYGFPLAAHIKRMKRKAIHLGGATQILFGIKGKRWESIPKIAALMNEHWTRPLSSEVPDGSIKVEGGAYW